MTRSESSVFTVVAVAVAAAMAALMLATAASAQPVAASSSASAAHRTFVERRAEERGRVGLALMPRQDPTKPSRRPAAS